MPCVTCPRGFSCGARDGGAVIEGCGKGYTTNTHGQSSCSVEEPKLIFLMVCSAVGVCFCGCVLSFRDDRYIGIRAAVASVTFAVHIL